MREIKFRAWDSVQKRMIEWETLPSIRYLLDNCYEVMQYTGLKDRNGKEIYEGDIVGIKSHWLVYWGKQSGQWRIKDGRNRSSLAFFLPDAEVFGNIHQNPELLTTEQ